MGTKGSPTWGGEPTLYAYWGGRIADDLVAALRVGTTAVFQRCVVTLTSVLALCFRRSRRARGRASW